MKMKFVVPILIGTLLSGMAAAYANMNGGRQLTLAQGTQKSEQNQLLKSACPVVECEKQLAFVIFSKTQQ